MNKRSFFKKILLSLGAMGLIPGAASAQSTKAINGKFIHMVFFWLKPATDVDEFVKTTDAFLREVRVIRSYHLGKPAMTPRDIVDNSYSVSLVATFDTKEDQHIYQKHPVHVKYVEDNNTKWSDVKIFDSWSTL